VKTLVIALAALATGAAQALTATELPPARSAVRADAPAGVREAIGERHGQFAPDEPVPRRSHACE